MRILVDMDGVTANFNKRVWEIYEEEFPMVAAIYPPMLDGNHPFYMDEAYDDLAYKTIIQGIWERSGFYKELEPIEGAIEALYDLERDHEVFMCTSPSLTNPTCACDKLWWMEHHMNKDWAKRTIITKDKTVIDADILIDDKPIIEGITETPIWMRIIFDQPYNKNIVGRRLNWKNYRSVINSVW